MARVGTYSPHKDKHQAGGSDAFDSALALAAMADLATGKIWEGNTNRPAEVDPTLIASGTYTGDDSVNRGIAHGLGVAPKIVFLYDPAKRWFHIIDNLAKIPLDETGGTHQHHAVTAPDTTNFYVGNATSYLESANGATTLYQWVAIG